MEVERILPAATNIKIIEPAFEDFPPPLQWGMDDLYAPSLKTE
jgi:hypothetical protein